MTREEHKNIVNQLLGMATPENQATASELLTRLTDDYEETLTAHETASASVATLTANNETLRKVNADLFLRVGVGKPQDPAQEPHKEEPETELTFEKLFNEKGELM